MPHMNGAIALQPTSNTQGAPCFLNINSGRCIMDNHLTVLPMPTEVIHTIHRLAAICKKYKVIVFTDKLVIINDDTPTNDINTTNPEITGVYREITGVDRLQVLPQTQTTATQITEMIEMMAIQMTETRIQSTYPAISTTLRILKRHMTVDTVGTQFPKRP